MHGVVTESSGNVIGALFLRILPGSRRRMYRLRRIVSTFTTENTERSFSVSSVFSVVKRIFLVRLISHPTDPGARHVQRRIRFTA